MPKIYTLFLEHVQPGISHNKCIGKRYKTLEKAIKACHKYSNRYLGSDYFFLYKSFLTSNEGESIMLSCYYDQSEHILHAIYLTVDYEDWVEIYKKTNKNVCFFPSNSIPKLI